MQKTSYTQCIRTSSASRLPFSHGAQAVTSRSSSAQARRPRQLQGFRDDASADHTLAKINLHAANFKRSKRPQSLTDWRKFREDSDPHDSSPFADYYMWMRHIHHRTQLHPQKLQQPDDAPAADAHLLHLWEARHSLIRRWKRNKCDRHLRKRISLLNDEIATYSDSLTEEHWYSTCDRLSNTLNLASAWRLVRSLVNPSQSKTAARTSLHKLLDKYTAPDQLVQALRDKYITTPMQPAYNDYAGRKPDDHSLSVDITLAELKQAVAETRVNTAPGPDRITPQQLRNLTDQDYEQLLALMNESWCSGLLPNEWKTAMITFIPKPGKPHDIENLRPISLTSSAGKLIERVILRRLHTHLDNTQHLPHSLIGYRQHISTQDALIQLQEEVFSTPSTAQLKAILAIDLHEAFDNVHHDSVLEELQGTNCGTRIHLEQNGTPIPQPNSIRLLGLHIQRDGGGSTKVNHLLKQGEHVLNLLRRVSTSSRGLKERSMMRLCDALLISRLRYHLPYTKLTQRQKIKLYALIRKGIKLAMGLPITTSTHRLLDMGYHNTVDELVAIHIRRQEIRLLLTPQGRHILTQLGHNVPSSIPLKEAALPTTTRSHLIIAPLPRHMHPMLNLARRARRIAFFTRYTPRTPHRTYLYTSASTTDTRTAIAVTDHHFSTIHTATLPPMDPCLAELHAIAAAITYTSSDSFTSSIPIIFTDSMAACRRLIHNSLPLAIAEQIERDLLSPVEVVWIPGHGSMPGNEKAHLLARETLYRAPDIIRSVQTFPAPSSVTPKVTLFPPQPASTFYEVYFLRILPLASTVATAQIPIISYGSPIPRLRPSLTPPPCPSPPNPEWLTTATTLSDQVYLAAYIQSSLEYVTRGGLD
ncbi:hypothetical protein HPB47_014144 [Ixodes persulcatus]|uniref:Uncharacterized protein n=1 Tax=Ixodes persulcatus TaxID=34615 RepID=A0AC60QWN7_IXOPE|nr:hypothetical protein HPB47_014144 [Ixodes persulcatus]